eukprot:21615_1
MNDDELLFQQMRERKKRAQIEKKEKAKKEAEKKKQFEAKKAVTDKNNNDIQKMMADMNAWSNNNNKNGNNKNHKNGKVANAASQFQRKQVNGHKGGGNTVKKGRKFSIAAGPKKSYSDKELQNEMKKSFGRDITKITMVKLAKYDGDIPLVLYLLGNKLEEIRLKKDGNSP